MIKFESYTKVYLESSWRWLNDPYIKFLTNTSDFTKEQQIKWFENLKHKKDYIIWGVSFDDIPIGVFGVKNIDVSEKKGEYWGYIGEKEYHGKGLGSIILENVIEKSISELSLNKLYLKVLCENIIAINLYNKYGFFEVRVENNLMIMEKYFI